MNDVIPPEQLAGIEHPIPYCYVIASSAASILVYGSAHLGPGDVKQAGLIFNALLQFAPTLIVIEGFEPLRATLPLKERASFIEKIKFGSIEESLCEGERGVALLYGSNNEIPIFSPEPTINEQRNFLQKQGAHPFRIDLFFAVRTVSSLMSYFHQNYEAAVTQMLARQRPDTRLFGLTPDRFKLLLRSTNLELPTDIELLRAAFDPTLPHKSDGYLWTNEIARSLTILRDSALVNFIFEKANNLAKIFVLYGASHAVAIEPALRSNLDTGYQS